MQHPLKKYFVHIRISRRMQTKRDDLGWDMVANHDTDVGHVSDQYQA